MNNKSESYMLRLGAFILVGLILFVVAIFLIGRQKNIFNPVYRLSTTFRNVSGLEVGNNVRFSGINIGSIGNIVIVNDTTVQVDMVLKKNLQPFIKTDCLVTIGSEGIIGDRILTINQGSSDSPFARNGYVLASAEPIETDAIISSLSVTADNFKIISGQLAEIMVRINNGEGTLGRLIQDSVISQNLSDMVVNLKKSTKGLNENMEAAKRNILLRGYFNKKERQAKRDSIQEERAKKKEEK
ncbi:MAG TPA: MlaD family protein [Bacteroidales bacterium]|nr:MlaD family protein [Bacteroidales bacterium]